MTNKFIAETAELVAHNNEQFVYHTYLTLLFRKPDPEGFKNYLIKLKNGKSKENIIAEIKKSAEYILLNNIKDNLSIKKENNIISHIKRFIESINTNKEFFPKYALEAKKIDFIEVESELRKSHSEILARLDEISRELNYILKKLDNESSSASWLSDINSKEEDKKKSESVGAQTATADAKKSLIDSNLFDALYYLNTYTDVTEAGIDPLEHYLNYGWREGRNPSKDFNTKFYLEQHKDVSENGMSPLLHYALHGIHESRAISKNCLIPSTADAINLFSESPKTIKSTYAIDILIPIYNGFDYLEPLFNSVKLNTDVDYRVILINDCSPDPKISEFLKKIQLLNYFNDLTIIENDTNLGFVRSVNKGLQYVKNNFVLLNTDTEVPPEWASRLMDPIFLMEKIASTTPFTNAGTIFSFPTYLHDNTIFENLSVTELDSYFKKVNFENSYTCVPTGVGFCMGINKNLVDKIGMFDEIFGKGYGEENDWCQRALNEGYLHLHVTNLFVYHKHGGSFDSETKKLLIQKNSKILLQRYPTYDAQIQVEIESNNHELLRKLICSRVANKLRKSHLIVDHLLGGGANHYTSDKINNLLKNGDFTCQLNFDFNASNQYLLTVRYDSEILTLKSSDISECYKFVDFYSYSEIYINSLVSFTNLDIHISELLRLKKKSQSSNILTIPIHDFFPLCSNYTLLNEKMEFCNIPKNPDTCTICIEKNTGDFKKFEHTSDIKTWRRTWIALLSEADEVTCFSESSKSITAKAYPSLKSKIRVLPHQIGNRFQKIYDKRNNLNNKALVIGVLGGINIPKGAGVLAELVKYIEHKNLDMSVKLIGEISHQINSNKFSATGKYDIKNAESIILDACIDVFLIPSIWPETYSYTTEEVMQLGYPIIVFDIGAPAERVKKYELGHVIKETDLYATLQNELQKKLSHKSLIAAIKIKS